jgi:hypothetical protein
MTAEQSIGGVPSTGEQAAEGVVEHAQSVAAQARARTREQVDQRSIELGARASTVAEDLRGVAEHLRSQGKSGPARLVEQAAQRAAGAGDYLQRTDGDQLLHDVESLGRRRPWTAIAGGLAAGVAASRLLKASSADRYRTADHRPPARVPGAPQPRQTQAARHEAPRPGNGAATVQGGSATGAWSE